MTDQTRDIVGQLFDVHQRMMIAQQRQRSYPVKLELGKADPDAILTAYLHIEALTKRVAELEEALTKIAKVGCGAGADWSDEECARYWSQLALGYRRIANAALSNAARGEP